MNTEKQVTITQLKAKYTKDFDNFGKMDPFLELTVGKCTVRTETAEGGGKEPAWKDALVLTFFDEAHISLVSFDSDATSAERMGNGKLEIKSLQFPAGEIEVTIASDSGESIGTVTGKYTIKNLAATPLLLAKNFKVQLVKESKLFSKARPYLQISTEEGSIATNPKDEMLGTLLGWNETMRVRIKESSKIEFNLIDKDDNSVPMFKYECSAKEFRLQNGAKKFTVLDKDYTQLGWLSFDYETVNLVSKEESVKNQEKQKKSENEVTAIKIEDMKVTLPKEDVDVYYRIIVGKSSFKSEQVSNSPKEASLAVNKSLLAEPKENKLIVVVWEKNLIQDEILAFGDISLESLSNGENRIGLLKSDSEDEVGSVRLNLTTKQEVSKTLTLEGINIAVSEDGDFIGGNDPYVKALIGCLSARTETGNNGKMTFKKGIELKYCAEESVTFEVWDEDVITDSLMYSQNIQLSELKQKGEYSVSVPKVGAEGEASKNGKISFKYEFKNRAESSVEQPRKQTVKAAEVASKKQIQTERVERVERAAEKQNERESSRSKKKSMPDREEDDDHEQLAINRSKDTLNLPSIVNNSIYSNVYGDRIFDKQSAATLQKSILAYSMPKANRFSQEPKYSGEPSYCIDSCFKKNTVKGAGFGFGRKKQFPDWQERNMKELPAPGIYFDGDSDLHNRGPTFGLSHKYYEKVLIPREKRQKPSHQPTARKLSPIRDPMHK